MVHKTHFAFLLFTTYYSHCEIYRKLGLITPLRVAKLYKLSGNCPCFVSFPLLSSAVVSINN